MTLPRILSAVGRTLAVLGAVMLLFVVFQLWGTGLQQAQAQSNLEGDLAERFRIAAEAGQGARRPAAGTPDAADGSFAEPDPGGATDPPAAPAPPAAASESGGRAPATKADAVATEAENGPAQPDPGSAAAQPDGPETPDEPEGDPAAAAPSPEPAAVPPSATGEAAPSAAQPVTADRPPPVSLPELPSLPDVVSHISEPAPARAVARLLDREVEEMLPLVYPEAGEAIARILIPSIDLDSIVVSGVEVEDLRKGPGHYSTTPLPGQPGNAAIAGHRTTYGAPFGRLNELNAGDSIIVETLQGRFVYRVLPGQPGMAGHALGFRIVAPTALEVLDDVGDNRLTLTSCHPKYSSKKRIIVHAALVGDPVVRLPRPGEPVGADYVQLAELAAGETDVDAAGAAQAADEPEAPGPAGDTSGGEDDAATAPAAVPASPGIETETLPSGKPAPQATGSTPTESGTGEDARQATTPARQPAPQAPPAPVTEAGFGEGLNGDRDAILPAVLWGLAAAAVWMVGWTIGRSGRRALRYTVAVVPFLVILYVMFSYVDRALPAY
ncbi:MAG: sortase [bacterium]|nr:sortase [bacterium]